MISRRSFMLKSSITIIGTSLLKNGLAFKLQNNFPVVISTWDFGLPANEAAWKILSNGGYSLDAVEQGVRVPEDDPNVMSVGYGGIPDSMGKVTLDASIMDEKGRAGSVTFLQHIKHPVSVARILLEKKQFEILSGKGALKFALNNGFKKDKLLTPESKAEWKKWKKEVKESNSNEIGQSINLNKTFGMLAIDQEGRISGACSSSGISYKKYGVVGDSAIIGAGLYIDGKAGGAVATGNGDLIMKTLGSFFIVEMMRNGKTPKEACEEAIKRIVQKSPDYEHYQVGFLALNKTGEYSSYSIQPGFNFAVKTDDFGGTKEAEAWLKTL